MPIQKLTEYVYYLSLLSKWYMQFSRN